MAELFLFGETRSFLIKLSLKRFSGLPIHSPLLAISLRMLSIQIIPLASQKLSRLICWLTDPPWPTSAPIRLEKPNDCALSPVSYDESMFPTLVGNCAKFILIALKQRQILLQTYDMIASNLSNRYFHLANSFLIPKRSFTIKTTEPYNMPMASTIPLKFERPQRSSGHIFALKQMVQVSSVIFKLFLLRAIILFCKK